MPHLRLQDAFLCLDCETIATNPTQCVVCTSKAVHPVAGFLNRTPKDVRDFLLSPQAETLCEMVSRIDLVPDMSNGETQL